MTVQELIDHLHTFPPDADVVIDDPMDGNGPRALLPLTTDAVYADDDEGKQIIRFSW